LRLIDLKYSPASAKKFTLNNRYDEEIDTLTKQTAELQRELTTARGKAQRNDVVCGKLVGKAVQLNFRHS
jgi:hypothetical protein